MPTPQEIYDELNKRGTFRKDPKAATIAHELRRRGAVHDPTQGGLVTIKAQNGSGSSSNDPYGDPADGPRRPARPATHRTAPEEAATPLNFFKDLVGANGKRGEIHQGLIDLIGANPKQKHGAFYNSAVAAGKTLKTVAAPLIPGNDNPLTISAGNDAVDNTAQGALEGALNDPFIKNAGRVALGKPTHLGRDIMAHKLQTLADFLPAAGAVGHGLGLAGRIAKAAGATRLAGGLAKGAEVAHSVATLGPVGRAAAKAPGAVTKRLSSYLPGHAAVKKPANLTPNIPQEIPAPQEELIPQEAPPVEAPQEHPVVQQLSADAQAAQARLQARKSAASTSPPQAEIPPVQAASPVDAEVSSPAPRTVTPFNPPRVQREGSSVVPAAPAEASPIEAPSQMPTPPPPGETEAPAPNNNEGAAPKKKPEYAGSINLDRMNLTPEARARVQSAADRLSAGETLPHDAAKQAAKDLGLTPEMLADIKPGEVPSGVHPVIFDKAVRDLHAATEEKAETVLKETAGDNSPEAEAARTKAQSDADLLFAHDSALSRVAGQHLGGRNMIASPLEAATESAQGKQQALAKVAALRSSGPAMKMQTQGKPSSGPKTTRVYGAGNTVVTEDAKNAALARIRANATRVHSGLDPALLKDAAIVGGYHIEAGVRKFGAWAAQMDKDVPGMNDAQKQQVYAAARTHYAEEAGSKFRTATKSAGDLVFADALAPQMGREGASRFIDALADHPAHPELLGKLLSGDPLSAAERGAVNTLYREHLPTRGGRAVTPQSLAALRDITQEFAKENARQRLAAARAAKPRTRASGSQDALTKTLTARLGKEGAQDFEARLSADPATAGAAGQSKSVMTKLRSGSPLADAESRAVAGHLDDLKAGRKAPSVPSDVSKTLTGIVRDAKAGRLGYDSAKSVVKESLQSAVPPERLGAVRAALASIPDNDYRALGDTYAKFSPSSAAEVYSFALRSSLLSGPLTLKSILASHLLGAAVEDTATRAAAAAVDPFIAWLLNDKTGRSIQGFRPGLTARAAVAGMKAIPEGYQYLKEGPTAMQLQGMAPDFRLHESPGGHLESEPTYGKLTGLVRFFPRTHGAVFHVIGKGLELRGRLEAAELKAARQGGNAKAYLHDPDVTKAAMEYRREQLYGNPNAAADAVQSGTRSAPEFAKGLVSTASPFLKIPSNLAMRGIEYSGAGLPIAAARAAGVRMTGRDFATLGEVAPKTLTLAEQQEKMRGFRANVARQAGRGIAGIGAAAAGAAATKAGILVPPNEKKHEYGHVNLGDYSFDTSRLEPVMTAPNFGGEIEQRMSGEGGDMTAPFTSNPYFNIGNTLANVRDAGWGKPGAAERLIGRQFAEYIPTLLSQVASYTDPSGETRKQQAIQDYLMNKVPGLREQLETTGRTQPTNIKSTPVIGLASPVAVQPRKPLDDEDNTGGRGAGGRASDGPPRAPRGPGRVRSLSEYRK